MNCPRRAAHIRYFVSLELRRLVVSSSEDRSSVRQVRARSRELVARQARIAEERQGSGKVRDHESVSGPVGATGACIPGEAAVEREGGGTDAHTRPHFAQGG